MRPNTCAYLHLLFSLFWFRDPYRQKLLTVFLTFTVLRTLNFETNWHNVGCCDLKLKNLFRQTCFLKHKMSGRFLVFQVIWDNILRIFVEVDPLRCRSMKTDGKQTCQYCEANVNSHLYFQLGSCDICCVDLLVSACLSSCS